MENAGQYDEQSAQLNLDLKEDGSFLWLDVEDDGDLDLFRSTSQSFLLFRNQSGSFVKETVSDNPGGVATTFDGSNSLNLADYDNDGDLDIFAASEQGNALLKNEDGSLTLISPDSLGLPAHSLMAQWVDYDNDGRMDLYSLPEGLYRQTAKTQFTKLSLLDNQSPQGILEARATWFDVDGDGDRDLMNGAELSRADLSPILD